LTSCAATHVEILYYDLQRHGIRVVYGTGRRIACIESCIGLPRRPSIGLSGSVYGHPSLPLGLQFVKYQVDGVVVANRIMLERKVNGCRHLPQPRPAPQWHHVVEVAANG